MKILVCVKQVPDTTKVKVDPETGVLQREGVSSKLNPYDLYAIELALELRSQYGGTVWIVTMGPKQAGKAVLEAIYMGADEGWVISDKAFAGSDVLATSYTLSQAVEKIGPVDLIVCGKQTTDGDTAQVGVELAEFLNIPHTTHVTALKMVDGGTIVVRTSTEETNRIEKIPMPCLLCVGDGINTPRLPSYRRKKEVKENRLHWLTLQELEDSDPDHYGLQTSPTQVVRIFEPEKKQEKQLREGTPKQMAEILFGVLVEKKMV